jgi:hypothetical protein
MKLPHSPLGFLCAVSLLMMGNLAYSVGGPPEPPLDPPLFDYKHYRANACQARPLDLVTYEWGGICNFSDSASEIELNCPIVRDNVLNVDWVVIAMDVGVTSLPVECTATSWNGFQVTDEVTAVAPCCGFVNMVLELQESTAGGYYSLSCTVPSDACVLGYKVMEWQGSWDNMTDYNR